MKGWGNCDITEWPDNVWHMLLLFMPPGSGANTGLETCDPQGVFRLFAFCRPLYALLPQQARAAICDLLPRARNDTMHSGTQEIDEDPMKRHMEPIIELIDTMVARAQAQLEAAGDTPATAAGWRAAKQACENAGEQVRYTPTRAM